MPRQSRAASPPQASRSDHLLLPPQRTRDGEPVQAFTAIGEIAESDAYPFDMGGGFVPYRRAVRFYASVEAPIRPLLPLLSFARDRRDWGLIFRRGVFPIDKPDYETIARAMRASSDAISLE